MEVIDEEDVSAFEAKQLLDQRKKAGALSAEQSMCMELLEKTIKLTAAQARDLQEELGKIAILNKRYMALIMNVMPDTEEEVESLFSKERTNLTKEEMKQIADIVKKFKK